jgi:hypothetical protein
MLRHLDSKLLVELLYLVKLLNPQQVLSLEVEQDPSHYSVANQQLDSLVANLK